MTDTVKNMHDFLEDFERQLKQNAKTAQMNVSRMGLVNTDPGLAQPGWVGIYMDDVSYDPRTLGSGFTNWEFVVTLQVIIQASHAADSKLAHKRLEEYIKNVLDVLLTDVTINNNVEKLDSLNVEYVAAEDDKSSLHFEGALLSMQFTGRTN